MSALPYRCILQSNLAAILASAPAWVLKQVQDDSGDFSDAA